MQLCISSENVTSVVLFLSSWSVFVAVVCPSSCPAASVPPSAGAGLQLPDAHGGVRSSAGHLLPADRGQTL